MTVRNLESYHGATREYLETLSTRHLLAILESARKTRVCGCHRHHCGDEWLGVEDAAFNLAQHALKGLLKDVLKTRDHLIRSTQRQRRALEKKVMRY